MQIIIADDDAIARRLAQHALADFGLGVTSVEDGESAWRAVSERREATLLVLDRMMPGMEGVDVVRKARSSPDGPPLYIVMVTSAGRSEDIAEGLELGADDYVVKPFNHAELRARAVVGMRLLAMQESLGKRVSELEQALENVKQLKGLLPMCAYCKKIRVDEEYWQQVEGYIADHSDATFTHGICPTCFPAVMDQADNAR